MEKGERGSLRLRFNIIVYNQRIKIDRMRNNVEDYKIFSMEIAGEIKIAFLGSKTIFGMESNCNLSCRN